ncbi:hypothetical protein [uncultured Alsobacter sp.]|uniref:hypothetical protein n=1 Tax=uncultured Alsobacter sp. TaxID=1748258 RepID=UPI0025E45AD1|nr:hypothetical protein [uncultured Alsobacter sp.]
MKRRNPIKGTYRRRKQKGHPLRLSHRLRLGTVPAGATRLQIKAIMFGRKGGSADVTDLTSWQFPAFLDRESARRG